MQSTGNGSDMGANLQEEQLRHVGINALCSRVNAHLAAGAASSALQTEPP